MTNILIAMARWDYCSIIKEAYPIPEKNIFPRKKMLWRGLISSIRYITLTLHMHPVLYAELSEPCQIEGTISMGLSNVKP